MRTIKWWIQFKLLVYFQTLVSKQFKSNNLFKNPSLNWFTTNDELLVCNGDILQFSGLQSQPLLPLYSFFSCTVGPRDLRVASARLMMTSIRPLGVRGSAGSCSQASILNCCWRVPTPITGGNQSVRSRGRIVLNFAARVPAASLISPSGGEVDWAAVAGSRD